MIYENLISTAFENPRSTFKLINLYSFQSEICIIIIVFITFLYLLYCLLIYIYRHNEKLTFAILIIENIFLPNTDNKRKKIVGAKLILIRL